MAKIYQLKKEFLSEKNLNRLVKKVIDNVSEDRKELKAVLDEAKLRLKQVEELEQDRPAEGEITAHALLSYTDTLKAVVPLFKEVQNVNSTLLKAMSIIAGAVKPAKAGKGEKPGVSLFEELDDIIQGNKDGKEDQ